VVSDFRTREPMPLASMNILFMRLIHFSEVKGIYEWKWWREGAM
jgi:hypothetical protein